MNLRGNFFHLQGRLIKNHEWILPTTRIVYKYWKFDNDEITTKFIRSIIYNYSAKKKNTWAINRTVVVESRKNTSSANSSIDVIKRHETTWRLLLVWLISRYWCLISRMWSFVAWYMFLEKKNTKTFTSILNMCSLSIKHVASFVRVKAPLDLKHLAKWSISGLSIQLDYSSVVNVDLLRWNGFAFLYKCWHPYCWKQNQFYQVDEPFVSSSFICLPIYVAIHDTHCWFFPENLCIYILYRLYGIVM